MADILNKLAPLKDKSLRKSITTWVTSKYRDAKRIHRQLERAWKKNKTAENTSKLRCQISKSNAIINKAKSDFYTDTIQTNADNPKKLWKELNILHRTSETVLPERKDDKTLADMFCSFFADKITRIRTCTFTTQLTRPICPERSPAHFDNFTAANEGEVFKMITSSATKSCLLDPLPTFFVKECADILVPSLMKLIKYDLCFISKLV